MEPLLYILAFFALQSGTFVSATKWDYVVMHQNAIEFYDENFTNVVADIHCFINLTAMTYDPVGKVLFIANFEDANTTVVYGKSLAAGTDNDFVKRASFPSRIGDMVYDPVTKHLFWTSSKGVYSFYTVPEVEVRSEVLVAYGNGEFVGGISIDNCRGVLYWVVSTYENSSIVEFKIDNKSIKEHIIVKDSYLVRDIAVDQVSKKLYWLDESRGTKYSIHGANLDGSNQTELHVGRSHEAIRLSVFDSNLYWTENNANAIYKYDVTKPDRPKYLKSYKFPPMVILKNHDISRQISNVPECQNLMDEFRIAQKRDNNVLPLKNNTPYCLNSGVLRNSDEDIILNRKVCTCSNEFEGDRCERFKCYHYCINNAQCSVDINGIPICRCSTGYNGVRCEHLSCEYFCKNNASCESKGDNVICSCMPGFSGNACEIEISTTDVVTTTVITTLPTTNDDFLLIGANTSIAENITQIAQLAVRSVNSCANTSYNMIIITLSCVVCLLIILVAILSFKMMRYSKRPRIIRKIIGKRASTTRSDRPIRNGCEITIEDCCNMNICDTPCFEPNSSFVDGNHKNDKMTLLYNRPYFNDS